MAILPDDPKKKRGVIAIGVSLVVLGVVYQYVWSPGTVELEAMEARLATLEAANRSAQLMYARGRGVEEQLELYQRHVERLEELIPQAEEVPRLVRDITSAAQNVNVEVVGITPEGEQPEQHYTRVTYSFIAVGEYHNIGRFLTGIASLPRIITPFELDLVPFTRDTYAGRMENPVQATFRIQTYTLPEAGSAPPPADLPGGEE